jgi:hypothetical protein
MASHHSKFCLVSFNIPLALSSLKEKRITQKNIFISVVSTLFKQFGIHVLFRAKNKLLV